MIRSAIQRYARNRGCQEAIVTAQRGWTFAQLEATSQQFARMWRDLVGRRVAVFLPNTGQMVASLAALDEVGATAVLPRTEQRQQAARELNALPCEAVIVGDHTAAEPNVERLPTPVNASPQRPNGARSSEVVLFTSGTSGPPKPAVHTWNSLAAAVRCSHGQLAGRRWLLAYQPTSFAGLQVILQALLSGGVVVVPRSSSAEHIAGCLLREQVEMVSATPTFWRNLLWTGELDRAKREQMLQITLGGEAAEQRLLDSLRELFPCARVSHVYASTEMGVCFAVHDGREGFPAAWLATDDLPCKLRIAEDGELLVRSIRRMRCYAGESATRDDWFPTGDLFRRAGDRCVFAGRKSDTIHVGGAMVYPIDVEDVIRQCPGVREVRVFGVNSSFAGQLVAAEVWTDGTCPQDQIKQRVVLQCRRQLARHAVPVIITVSSSSDQLPHKLSRQPVSAVG